MLDAWHKIYSIQSDSRTITYCIVLSERTIDVILNVKKNFTLVLLKKKYTPPDFFFFKKKKIKLHRLNGLYAG
jgi:hypothetical protein